MEARKQFLKSLLLLAGEKVKKNYEVSFKGKDDLCTSNDLEIESFIRTAIKEMYPNDFIMGEEYGGDLKENNWIIDPIDGTTNYAYSLPFYAISIAYVSNGKIMLGGVYLPYQKELFLAEDGKGAYLGEKRLTIKKDSILKDYFVGVDIKTADPDITFKNLEMVNRLVEQNRTIRILGSAASAICYVAANKLDAYMCDGVKIWDIAASLLILKEAGGVYATLQNEDVNVNQRKQNIIACKTKKEKEELLKKA